MSRNNRNQANNGRQRSRSGRSRSRGPYREPNMVSIPRPMAFPSRIECTENYVDTFILSTGASGVTAEYNFRLNSTFDPDLTGTGHQPFGRDQLAALYSKYRVLQVTVDIDAVILSSANCMAVVPVPSNTIAFASVGEAAEQPYAICHPIAGTYCKHYHMLVDLPTLLGQSITTFRGDDSNESIVGSNPSNNPTLHLVIQAFSGSVSTNLLKVQLRYRVEYFDLNSLVAS